MTYDFENVDGDCGECSIPKNHPIYKDTSDGLK